MKMIFKLIFLIELLIYIFLLNSCAINSTNKIINPKIIQTKILETNSSNIQTLARLYFKLGKARQTSFEINLAIKAFNQSIQKYKQLYPNSSNLYISKCYDELGKIYSFKQEYTKSLKYFQDSCKIKEKYYSSINKKIVKSYKYIGQVYIKLKKRDKALFYLEKAKLYSEHLDIDNPSPLTLELMAKISSLDAKYKGAFNKRGKIRLRDYVLKYGEQSIEVATLYKNMGIEYASKGKFELAFDAYRNATKIYKEILSPFSKELYRTLFELSKVSKKIGKNKIYLNSSIEAFESYVKNRQQIFSTFDIEEQIKFSKKRKKYLYILFDALNLSNNKNHINKVFNLWINYKRAIFDFENSLYILAQKDNYLEFKYREWNIKQRVLAHFKQENLTYNSKEILKKISNLEEDMSYIFSKYNFKIEFQDIIKLLNPHELYIDFAKSKENYYYFTLDKKANIQFNQINRKQTKEIDYYIKVIREDSLDAPLKITQQRYLKLYNLIFKNINLKDKTSLIISSDGLLGLIPFEAFYDKKDKKYLIEKVKIRYIPSGKEFVKLHNNSKTKNNDIVVFADVDFDNRNSKLQKTKGSIFKSLRPMKNLKYSKEDAMVIKKLFSHNVKLFLEENATEENLLKVNAPKILYLSTHGMFLTDKSILNPMLKSIILLDGANESIRQKRGNGIVSGLELAGLNLHGTELVVLSACETGVGEIEDSEGIAGMSKAFMKAGAKAVIMTLWSVDDEKSSLLMKKFYEGVKKGLGYSDALREAKLFMIKNKETALPFYWSGFVMNE